MARAIECHNCSRSTGAIGDALDGLTLATIAKGKPSHTLEANPVNFHLKPVSIWMKEIQTCDY